MLTIDWKIADYFNLSLWNHLVLFGTDVDLPSLTLSLVVKVQMKSAVFFKLCQGHVSLVSSSPHWSIYS